MRRFSPLLLTVFAAVFACTAEDDPVTETDAGGHKDATTQLDATTPPADGGDAAVVPPDSGIDDRGLAPDAGPDAGLPDGGDFGETRVPIMDMGNATYKGMFRGGLYANGENTIPEPHLSEGIARAQAMEPLDNAGLPSAMGKYVLMSMGMSNTTQEWCDADGTPPCRPYSFTGQALAYPDINSTTLAIMNGARGNQVATSWDATDDPNYDRVRDTVLAPEGLTEAQVRILWLKVANPTPQRALPESNADAYRLLGSMGSILRAAKIRYPNLTMVFLSSRIYAGYATTPLNPEPYAYETGFAVKMLIEAQIKQMADGTVDATAGDLDYGTVVPWIAWSAYLWADGATPRSDGLFYTREDLDPNDGTHPFRGAQEKVGTQLLNFFSTSPATKCWFLATGQCP
jgi:hypothetical protein